MPRQSSVPAATLNSLYEKVGEVGAIAREAKHAANGASQKIDVIAGKVDNLALVVTTQGQLRDIVDNLKQTVKDQGEEIEVLNADKHRREGAIGLVDWVGRNYPLIAAIIALAAWVGWVNGIFK